MKSQLTSTITWTWLPISVASRYGQVEASRLLLSSGVIIEACGFWFQVPLSPALLLETGRPVVLRVPLKPHTILNSTCGDNNNKIHDINFKIFVTTKNDESCRKINASSFVSLTVLFTSYMYLRYDIDTLDVNNGLKP